MAKPINRVLIEEIGRRRSWLVAIFVLILIGVGFRALAPFPFKLLIDNVLGDEPLDPTSLIGRLLGGFSSREALGLVAIFLYCISGIAVALAEYFATVATKKFSREIVRSFAQRAFDNFGRFSLKHYRTQNIGDYLYRLSYDVSAFGNLFEDGLLPFTTNLLYCIATITVLFLISTRLALLSLTVLPFLALGLFVFNRATSRATERSERSNSLLFSFIEGALKQLRIIQAFNQERSQAKNFREREHVALTDELRVYGLGFLLDAMVGIIVAVGYAVVLLAGIYAVRTGELSTGLLIVFIFYLDNLTYPLIGLSSAVTTFREEYIRVERMAEFFEPQFRIRDTGKWTDITDTEITFTNVTVYGDEKVPILKNASFAIPAGKRTVIVGVSGSGKTTIASLVLRFLEPDEGKIILGRQPLSDYQLQSLRAAIAYVPQEIVLFDDTIHGNIAFSKPEASFAEIHQAAHAAVADGFIEALPGAYEFEVGEAGENLSGGQRQRLLLARALLKTEAKLFVFDEPLSALDVETRATLMTNLDALTRDRTVIFITNILDVVDRADHVIVVKQGTITYAGSPAALRAKSAGLGFLLQV